MFLMWGNLYNEKTNRFDHHQKGGAEKRPNGIEYSSFGLDLEKIWFGTLLNQKKSQT